MVCSVQLTKLFYFVSTKLQNVNESGLSREALSHLGFVVCDSCVFDHLIV